MEASAFFQVCTYLNINGLAVIKGVTDMGDKYKGVGHERHYRPALRKTALATRRFLEYVLGEPDVDLEIGGKSEFFMSVPGLTFPRSTARCRDCLWVLRELRQKGHR